MLLFFERILVNMISCSFRKVAVVKHELLFDNCVSASFGCVALDRISEWQRDRR
jgi:hypothetical protein